MKKRTGNRKFKRICQDLILIAIIALVVSMGIRMVFKIAFETPQAATYDGGKTVVYFEIPSSDGKKMIRIYPNDKRFMDIMRGARYELIHIAPPRVDKTLEGE